MKHTRIHAGKKCLTAPAKFSWCKLLHAKAICHLIHKRKKLKQKKIQQQLVHKHNTKYQNEMGPKKRRSKEKKNATQKYYIKPATAKRNK